MANVKYKILKNDIFGRYMVAGRNLKAGELILSEKPTLLGPQLGGPLICFGCCRNVHRIGFVICKNCNTAILCNSKCTGSLHTAAECSYLKKLDLDGYILEQNDQCIFALRCLLLREYNPVVWKTFLELEPHLEQRRDTTIWRRNQITVEQVLRKLGILSPEDITNEMLQIVCGILDVNTFEVRPPQSKDLHISNPEVECLRGLYLNAAMMAHDCVGNTLLSVDSDFVLTIKASVDIPENHPVFFNYANVLQGTLDRKQHLREGKYFECSCKRCDDSTELGTDVSSLNCHKCRKGKIRIEDNKNASSKWICSQCKKEFSNLLIKTAVEEGRRRIEETDQANVTAMETLLANLLRTFHTNHFLMLELKQNLIGLHLRNPPTKENLSRKICLCQEILDVVTIIEPGISRIKAITLYQLQSALVDLAHKKYQDKQINLEKLVLHLLDAEKKLTEAIKYLIHEPTKSPEGNITQMALSELKMLRTSISNMQEDLLYDKGGSSDKLSRKATKKIRGQNSRNIDKVADENVQIGTKTKKITVENDTILDKVENVETGSTKTKKKRHKKKK